MVQLKVFFFNFIKKIKNLDEFDLDTILSELLELENQLSSNGDHLIHGLPALPQKLTSSNSYNQYIGNNIQKKTEV